MRFIRTREVLEMIGVCRTTLWEMVRQGAFPPPVRITERTSGYLLEAVEQWMHLRTKGLPWPPIPVEPTPMASSRSRLPVSRQPTARHESVR